MTPFNGALFRVALVAQNKKNLATPHGPTTVRPIAIQSEKTGRARLNAKDDCLIKIDQDIKKKISFDVGRWKGIKQLKGVYVEKKMNDGQVE